MELVNNIQSSKQMNNEKARDLYKKGLSHNALAYYFRALNAAEILHDTASEAEIKRGIMFCYANDLEYDQVLAYSDDLLNNYELASEKREIILTGKAFALSRKGQFRQAEQLLKDLLFSESQTIRFRAYTDLGLLYYFLSRFSEKDSLELAFEHLKTAYEYSVTLGNEKRYRAASNMGLIYLEKGDAAQALRYFEESLEYAESDLFQAQTQNELGRVYAKLGDLEKSEYYFEKTAKYALESGKFLTLTYNIYYRGLVQIDLDKKSNAYNYLHTALYSFLEHKHYPEVLAIYKILSSLFEESHPQRAEYFLNEYHHYLNYIDPLGDE